MTRPFKGFGCPTRLDRDKQTTGKAKGGGVCLYVNERWCKTVIVREQLCTPDIELLSVSLRPLYLPREFPQLFVTVVYIHPRANVDRAAQHICDVTQKLDALSTDAPKFILGDFNQCKLENCLPTYHQYITCPTRMNKQLTCATVRCPRRIGPLPSHRLVTPITTLSTWYPFINVS